MLDAMLGKLARWLRMMGYDTKYSNALSDAELLVLAQAENRVLLTRDFSLYQQAQAKNLPACYITGNTSPERLARLAACTGIALEVDLENTRCPKCNTRLQTAPKDTIAGKVEKNTLLYYDVFWLCPACGSVYWQGAHWTNIRAALKEAKEKQEKMV
ncbi:MAG: Mut7-C RNAse domain-containing protein [Candidatus Bathyarchaeota archaeon]|nr:Mut7-C RNAse domain-containing protein [Candidatus Bathyarchaeota archaeon]